MRWWALALVACIGCGDGMAKRLRPAGIYSDPSPEDAPDGALLDAKNVVFRRRGLAEPRPGFSARDISGDVTADGVRAIFPFTDYAGDKHHRILALEDFGEWSLASYRPGLTSPTVLTAPWADATDAMVPGRIHATRAADSLFVTSEEGVLRFDDGAVAPVFAGLPQALQPQLSTQSTTPTWLNNASVAYRIVYARDAGPRVVFSAPSPRIAVSDSSGAARSISLHIPLASSLASGDRVQIYRSQQKGVVGSEPTDEMSLRLDYTLTSSDVSSGSISWSDHLDDDEWTGASLYTNATQATAVQSNGMPPRCADVAAFQQMVFFASARTRHRFEGVVKAGLGLYSVPQNADEVAGAWAITGNTTLGSNVVTGISATDILELAEGQAITNGANFQPEVADATFPAGTEIVTIGASSITLNNNALSTSAGLSINAFDWLSVDGTRFYFGPNLPSVRMGLPNGIGSYARAINDNSAVVHAYVIVGLSTTDSVSASILLERRDGLDTAFDVRATKPGAWNVTISHDSDVASARQGAPNTLRWTKIDQPDHAPITFQARVGNESPILRIIPTRSSLLVFKPDGVWRVTGESPESLRIDEHDQSLKLLHPDLAVAMSNAVWAVTNKGIVLITDGGVEPVSDQAIGDRIASLIDTVRSGGYEAEGYWAAADEPNDEVLFSLSGASTPDDIYVFNTKTGAWAQWDLGEVIGSSESPVAHSMTYDDDTGTLVAGIENAGSVPWIFESRAGTGTNGTYDAADARTISIATDNGDGTSTLRISSASLQAGDVVKQSSRFLVVTDVQGSDYTGVHTSAGFTTGACTAYRSFESEVRWQDWSFGDADVAKQWTEAALRFERLNLVRQITQGFITDMSPTEGTFTHGVPYLNSDVGPIKIPAMPTLEHRRAGALRPSVTIRQAAADWALSAIHLRGAEMDHRMVRGSYR